MALRVLHLVGSPTSSFFADLSRLYARGALQALGADPRWETHLAHVDPGGTWRFPADLRPATLAAARSVDAAAAVGRIAALRPDVVVPQLFCPEGMTTYRGLFDLLGVPYVGNRPDVMALCADKARARAVVADAGVAVPAGEVLRAGDRPTIVPPAVVKPADADNSTGVGLVTDEAGYEGALREALRHGDRALVERYVPLGREVRCGVLERDGTARVLPLEEYRVDRVRTTRDKLGRDHDGELRLQAKDADSAWIVPDDDPVGDAVGEAALACHRALGGRHYGLFDFRVDDAGRPWFLEAGPYCSFSPQSVLAVMAAADGVPPVDLFAQMLEETRAAAPA